MAITQPNLQSVTLPFDPVSYWVGGDYDPAALVAALKQQNGLADFADENGNVQSAIRLDRDVDPANAGYWVSVPKGTTAAVVDAGVAAYVPPGPPSPPPSADAALLALSELDANTATVAQIVNTVKQALQAAAEPG